MGSDNRIMLLDLLSSFINEPLWCSTETYQMTTSIKDTPVQQLLHEQLQSNLSMKEGALKGHVFTGITQLPVVFRLLSLEVTTSFQNPLIRPVFESERNFGMYIVTDGKCWRLANYLERSLLVFRLLCYTQTDLLALPRARVVDVAQCSDAFFGARPPQEDCIYTRPLHTLQEPSPRLVNSSLRNVIVVRCAPASRDYRDFIRQTWQQAVDVPVVFVAGRGGHDLSSEARQHGDILQMDFLDAYTNLTLKMVYTYRFFLHRLPQLENIIAINDDTIVNATALRAAVRGSGNTMNGKVSRGYPRLIFPWLPWYVPSSIYPNLCYPPFVQGSSFVVPRAVAERIVDGICGLAGFPLDDVLMGVLARCLGIRLTHQEGFDRHLPDRFVVFHYQWSRFSPPQLTALWNSLHKSL